MNVSDVLFYLGGVSLGAAPWVQVVRIFRLRRADTMSLAALAGIVLGLLANEIAAVLIGQRSLLIANSVSLVGWTIVLFQKIYFDMLIRR